MTLCFYSRKKCTVSELDQLTGVAAILRFPMPELDDDEEDSDHET
jgi:protein pelota